MKTDPQEEAQNQETTHNAMDVVGKIALLPDTLFFYQVNELPDSLSAKQLNAWVYDTISEQAPFPIDQLSWGFVKRSEPSGNESILWYAGLTERIVSVVGELPKDLHTLPYFALGYLLAGQGTQIFTGDQYASVLANGKIFGFYKADEASFTHVQQNLLEAKAFVDERMTRVRFVDAYMGYSGDIKLSVECKSVDGSEKPSEFTIKSDVLWNADIHDKDFIQSIKTQRQISQFAEMGICAGCCFLAVVFAFELCLWGAKFSLGHKDKVKNKLQPKAMAIESKDFLTRKIQGTVEQEIRPFELLGILNSERPKSIYFLSATVDNLHNVIVEAISETAMEVEDYRQQLEESGYFQAINIQNITTTYQGTKFTLVCDFKEKQKTSFLSLDNPS